METTKGKLKRTSLVKQAAWLAVLDLVNIVSGSMILVKKQIQLTPEEFLATYPLRMFFSILFIIILLALLILTILHARNVEKEDELSRQNRYKAGFISKYICIIAIIAAICIIKDFSFAFTGDLFDDFAHIPLIILMFAQFVENVTFIILEKRNLE